MNVWWMYGCLYVCMYVYIYVCTQYMNVCIVCRCVDVVDVYMEYVKLNNIGVYKST
jgi:hypothetical protein